MPSTARTTPREVTKCTCKSSTSSSQTLAAPAFAAGPRAGCTTALIGAVSVFWSLRRLWGGRYPVKDGGQDYGRGDKRRAIGGAFFPIAYRLSPLPRVSRERRL